jgi:hypothetical protein
MSADDTLVCGRCGGANRPTASRCWVCYSPLGATNDAAGGSPGADAPAPTLKVLPAKKVSNPWVTALKIVIVLSIIIAAIPILLFITCVGIIAVSNPTFH